MLGEPQLALAEETFRLDEAPPDSKLVLVNITFAPEPIKSVIQAESNVIEFDSQTAQRTVEVIE